MLDSVRLGSVGSHPVRVVKDGASVVVDSVGWEVELVQSRYYRMDPILRMPNEPRYWECRMNFYIWECRMSSCIGNAG